jgi:hypothetical protein
MAANKHVVPPGGSIWWDDQWAWFQPGIPQADDIVYINQDESVTIGHFYRGTCASLYVGTTGGGGNLVLTGSALLTAFSITVGWSSSGTFDQQEGGVRCSNLDIGTEGGSGYYLLRSWPTGGYIGEPTPELETTFLNVGGSGTGIFTQEGMWNGTLMLTVGSGVGGNGLYNLNHGTLTADSETIGSYGWGRLVQAGGTNEITNDLNFAAQAGSTGIYDLRGGMLTVNGNITTGAGDGSLYINGGFLDLTGTISVGTLGLGMDSGRSGEYMVKPNGLGANILIIGSSGDGSFYQSVGLDYVNSEMHIGRESGGTGVYTLRGTGVLQAPLAYVGERGTGTVNQSAGQAYIDQLVLGREQAGKGYYNLSGTGYLSAGTVIVGEYARGTFHQTGGESRISSNLFIGNRAGGMGVYTQEAGTTTVVAGGVCIGNWQGSTGDYTLSGTGLLNTNYMQVGIMGTGTFHQNGGAVHVSSDLYVGNNGGSNGTYTQADGSNTVSQTLHMGEQLSSQGVYWLYGGTLTANTEVIGAAGSGRLHQPAGENDVTNNVHLGRDAGGDGWYGIGGGVGSVVTLRAHDVIIGGAGKGEMLVVDGGRVYVQRIRFADSSGSRGTLWLYGGTVSVENSVTTGQGDGALVLDGGTLQGISHWGLGSLIVSDDPTFTASYTFDGMEITASRNEIIGASGTAIVSQTSGSNIIEGALLVGQTNSAVGTYNLSGATTLLSAGPVLVGLRGHATFNQSGGTCTIAETLTVGVEDVGVGECHLTGGSMSAALAHIGARGKGSFYQVNGHVNISDTLLLGLELAGDGYYSLSADGELTAATEIVGDGAKGKFQHTSGTNTVNSNLFIGNHAGGNGQYLHQAGTATVVAGGVCIGNWQGSTGDYTLSGTGHLHTPYIQVGIFGTGTFHQDGGTVEVANDFYLGNQGGSQGTYFQASGSNTVSGILRLGQQKSSLGEYYLDGGQLYAGTELIGVSGTGSVEQTYGQNSVADDVCIGYGADGDGQYGISGGSFDARDLYLGCEGSGGMIVTGDGEVGLRQVILGQSSGSNGLLALRGGTVTVDSISTGSGQGTLMLEGGTLQVAGTIGVTTLDVGRGLGITASYTFVNKEITVSGTETVGGQGDGKVWQQGGQTVIHGNLLVGEASTAVGTYWLSGGTASADQVQVGLRGVGNLVVGGGHLDISGTLLLGLAQAGDGYFRLSNGMGVMGFLTAGTEIVGEGAKGVFLQMSGTNTVNSNLFIGNHAGGNGQYTHQAGPCNVTGTVCVGNYAGSVGDYTLNGTGHLAAGYVQVGIFGTGTFHQDGGTIEVTNYFYIGNQGGSHGTYFQTDGFNTVSGTLYMGSQSLSAGTFHLDGGQLSTAAEVIGAGGTGLMTQTTGTHTIAGGMTVGQAVGGSGTVNLQGGSLSSASVIVGGDGEGEFNQSGGTNSTGSLYLARYSVDASGTYGLTGGDLLLNGPMYVGYAGYGLVQHSGGVRSGGNLYAAYQAGAGGTYELSQSGSVSAADESIGHAGQGTFNQTGGLNIATNVTIGYASTGVGAYNLGGGTFQADSLVIGKAGAGVFSQTGGSGTIGGTITIADGESATGAMNISNGDLTAGAVVNRGAFSQTGGTLSTASLTNDTIGTASVAAGAILAADIISNFGVFSQTGGLLSGSTILGTFENTGEFTLSAGTFRSHLVNSGSFTYKGGTFEGDMENWGAFTQTHSFEAAGGIVNYGYLTTLQGLTISGKAVGISNFGILEMRAGASIVGAGGITNEAGGLLTGAGTIRTILANHGSLQPAGIFIVTGAVTNDGLISLGLTRSVLANGGFTNSGLVELAGGNVGGVNGFNRPGGIIHGYGVVSVPLTNDGGLIHANASGTLTINSLAGGNINGGELRVENGSTLTVTSAFTSQGTAVLNGLNAVLSGGAITNAAGATIRGQGRVANTVLNSGVVRAEGGQLTLSGSGATNTSTGTIQAAAGASVFYTQGLATNAGAIALSGGTFDNNNRTLTNNGFITGYGTVRAGWLTNSSGKNIGVGSGNLDVIGPVTNGGTITTQAGRTTTFYNAVNGNGTFPGTGTVAFLGGYSPGSSPGIIAFGGDVTFGGFGVLKMELAENDNTNPAVPRYDALHVARNVSLGGILNLDWVPRTGEAASKFGGTYDLITYAGQLDGTFTVQCDFSAYIEGINYAADVGGGLKAVRLKLHDLLDGDADLNGMVGYNDLLALATGFGGSNKGWYSGDFSLDGQVDALDYILLKTGFGRSVSISGSVPIPGSVPEPATLSLLALGGLAMIRRRRK